MGLAWILGSVMTPTVGVLLIAGATCCKKRRPKAGNPGGGDVPPPPPVHHNHHQTPPTPTPTAKDKPGPFPSPAHPSPHPSPLRRQRPVRSVSKDKFKEGEKSRVKSKSTSTKSPSAETPPRSSARSSKLRPFSRSSFFARHSSTDTVTTATNTLGRSARSSGGPGGVPPSQRWHTVSEESRTEKSKDDLIATLKATVMKTKGPQDYQQEARKLRHQYHHQHGAGHGPGPSSISTSARSNRRRTSGHYPQSQHGQKGLYAAGAYRGVRVGKTLGEDVEAMRVVKEGKGDVPLGEAATAAAAVHRRLDAMGLEERRRECARRLAQVTKELAVLA